MILLNDDNIYIRKTLQLIVTLATWDLSRFKQLSRARSRPVLNIQDKMVNPPVKHSGSWPLVGSLVWIKSSRQVKGTEIKTFSKICIE